MYSEEYQISHKLQENFMEILDKNKVDKVRHFGVTDNLQKIGNIFGGKRRRLNVLSWQLGHGEILSKYFDNKLTIFLGNILTFLGGKEKKTECPVVAIGALTAVPDRLSALQTLVGNQPSSNVQSAASRSAFAPSASAGGQPSSWSRNFQSAKKAGGLKPPTGC